jgi:hypothetical protein
MPEITLGLDGYISPIMPLRNYELVLEEEVVKGRVKRVVDRIRASDVEEAMRIAKSLYPESNIRYEGVGSEEKVWTEVE